VSSIALEYGAEEGEAIAVLLHDASEDACMCLAWRPRCSYTGLETRYVQRALNRRLRCVWHKPQGVRQAARPGRDQNRPPRSRSRKQGIS